MPTKISREHAQGEEVRAHAEDKGAAERAAEAVDAIGQRVQANEELQRLGQACHRESAFEKKNSGMTRKFMTSGNPCMSSRTEPMAVPMRREQQGNQKHEDQRDGQQRRRSRSGIRQPDK